MLETALQLALQLWPITLILIVGFFLLLPNRKKKQK